MDQVVFETSTSYLRRILPIIDAFVHIESRASQIDNMVGYLCSGEETQFVL